MSTFILALHYIEKPPPRINSNINIPRARPIIESTSPTVANVEFFPFFKALADKMIPKIAAIIPITISAKGIDIIPSAKLPPALGFAPLLANALLIEALEICEEDLN